MRSERRTKHTVLTSRTNPRSARCRNRNNYAALLCQAIRNKDFREPFHRSPPDGPLQMLGAHLKVKAGEVREWEERSEAMS